MEDVRATFVNRNLSAKDATNAELFLANYYGETEVAKWALGFVKGGVHDGEFIPWMVMTTALKLLDWNSTIELVENEDGGYIFRDGVSVETSQVKVEGLDDKGNDIIRSTKTSNTTNSFYVKVKIVYFGETTIHEYAVLDTGHQPVQYLNSQLVNKAIQRNKARAVSLVTGIGLTLWTQEAVEQELKADAKDKPVTLSKEEPVKAKLTKGKESAKIEDILPNGIAVEDLLAEALVANLGNKDFLGRHKRSLDFIKDTFGVDYMETDVKKLAKTLLNVNDLEGFAKLILGSL